MTASRSWGHCSSSPLLRGTTATDCCPLSAVGWTDLALHQPRTQSSCQMFRAGAPTADEKEPSELVQPLCSTGDTGLNHIPEQSCFFGTCAFTSPSRTPDLLAGLSPVQELRAKLWGSAGLVLTKTGGNPPTNSKGGSRVFCWYIPLPLYESHGNAPHSAHTGG